MDLQFDYGRMKDAPSDPVTFVDIMFDHYKEIDTNKDKWISANELTNFLDTADPNSDIYATGLVVLANYELFSNLTSTQRYDSLDGWDFDKMERLLQPLPDNYVLANTLDGGMVSGTILFGVGAVAGALTGGPLGAVLGGCAMFVVSAPVGAGFAYFGAQNDLVNRQLLTNIGFKIKE